MNFESTLSGAVNINLLINGSLALIYNATLLRAPAFNTDKMFAIFQTMFLNSFSLMKIFVFLLEFHFILFNWQ